MDDARHGRPPQGEFAALVDLLTRQLAGTAPVRIRQANFLDLVGETLDACQSRIEKAMPAVRKLEGAIAHERMTAGRDAWPTRCARSCWPAGGSGRCGWSGKVASRWGFSPFALVLRVFQGSGGC